ncbi:4'-phosphopantetheinyl transferase [Gordoniibacillus kamchatkensis]|uniref:Holo-[acyl-carrier-protein] synthase n=1 Tax=Gordoniibacillus kamchatkensis TaxID=1590651 RepID=A0ABR5AMT5_9BACL|nr:holo-ACP synthase [Paenibacillus sp. VKM B-2647]KIL42343.1 4'-phosphopantetheinyl transferase [Paenibacillus sp. VKM B-2647]
MIIGVGVDLLDIERMRRIVESKSGMRFLQRVLTPAELELAAQRKGRLAEFAAGRFAAKEAVVKAIGCGIGAQVGFRDLEVLPGLHGKPGCTLEPAALSRLGWRDGEVTIHLSITHSAAMAAAYAIAERTSPS